MTYIVQISHRPNAWVEYSGKRHETVEEAIAEISRTVERDTAVGVMYKRDKNGGASIIGMHGKLYAWRTYGPNLRVAQLWANPVERKRQVSVTTAAAPVLRKRASL